MKPIQDDPADSCNTNQHNDDNTVDVSRDPADYSATDHFVIRARHSYGPVSETRAYPPITSDVIETCICDGEVHDAKGPESSRKFVADVDGIEWHLLVYGQRVITAFAPSEHYRRKQFGGTGE